MKALETIFSLLLFSCICPSRTVAQLGTASYGGYPAPNYGQQQQQQQQPYNIQQPKPTYPVTIGISRDNSFGYSSSSSGSSLNRLPGSGEYPSCRGQLIGEEYKYVCSGPTPTLSRKYVLWLQAGRSRPIRIDIPNYKLDDWIEAGFKRSPESLRSQINVFVRKPEISAHATAEETGPQEPDVNLEYEPVHQTTRHFGANEVQIVGPGVIQEPGQFGRNDGVRVVSQYKRDVKSVNEQKQPIIMSMDRVESPSPPPAAAAASQVKLAAAALPPTPMPMWSSEGWIPISGPNGQPLKF